MAEFWTKERLSLAQEYLKQYPVGKKDIVCVRLTEEFGREVTVDGLDRAFTRNQLGNPSNYMADGEFVAKKDREKVLIATHKDLLEQLEFERERNAFYVALDKPSKRLTIKAEEHGGVREMTALAALSDVHPEEVVDPRKVQGRNKFNLDIADLRIRRFFNGIVDLVTHHRASGKIVIRHLVLWLGGDLMTGHIHEDAKHITQLFPVETILWMHPRIKAGIQFVLEELGLDSIEVVCDIGNHGRTTFHRQIAVGPETSFEYGMYCQLARDFAHDSRVHFDTTPANDHYVDIYGFRLHTTHGDSIRYNGGVGGLTVPGLKAVMAWDTDMPSTWHLIGHFHTALDVDKLICNGSVIGWNPFAKWIKARYNERDLSQHFSLIDKERGRCHSTLIWVGKVEEELAFWTPEELKLRSQ